jgi:hypothetical protein
MNLNAGTLSVSQSESARVMFDCHSKVLHLHGSLCLCRMLQLRGYFGFVTGTIDIFSCNNSIILVAKRGKFLYNSLQKTRLPCGEPAEVV